MLSLDQTTYQQLCTDAQVLERDAYGEKVMRLSDGSFFKLFRVKRLISSSLLYPYAQRFADNAKHLESLSIPCPEVLAVYRIPGMARDLVHYTPLPGETLRALHHRTEDEGSTTLRRNLGTFVANLHDRGIYFRSLHLGNIVLTPEGRLGLIDIADLRTQKSPLAQRMRLRNFKHLLRYPDDRHWLLAGGTWDFFDSYLAATRLKASQTFIQRLRSL